MKWMEHYMRHVVHAARWDEPAGKYHAPDFFVQKPNEEFVKGADGAWGAVRDLYSPYQAFRHEPTFLVYWDHETGNEWSMIGSADVRLRLHVLDATDREGNKWDGHNIGAFLFRYADEGEGIKLKSTQILADSSPALRMMLQPGLSDAESFKGVVIGS